MRFRRALACMFAAAFVALAPPVRADTPAPSTAPLTDADLAKIADRFKALTDQNRFAEAVPLARTLVAEDRRRNVGVKVYAAELRTLGMTEVQAGEADAGIHDLQEAIALDAAASTGADDRALEQVMLGQALYRVGRGDDAIAALRRALTSLQGSSLPNRAAHESTVRFELGSFLLGSGAYDDAVREYDAVIADRATSPDIVLSATMFAARASAVGGHTAEGDRRFGDALRRASGNALATGQVLLLRATSRLADGRYADVQSDLDQIVRTVPDDGAQGTIMVAAAWSLRGTMEFGESRYSDAQGSFERARSIAGKVQGPIGRFILSDSYLSEGMLELRRGRYDEARKSMNEALARAGDPSTPFAQVFGADNPFVANVYISAGVAAYFAGALHEAKTDFDRALGIFTERLSSKSAMVALALVDESLVERDLGDVASARRDLERARGVDAAFGPGFPMLATIDVDLGALEYMQHNTPAARTAYARAFGEIQGQYESAFSFLGERDRLTFVAGTVPAFDGYLTLCLRDSSRDPQLAGDFYDVALFRKDLVAQSISALQTRVRTSHDPAVADDFVQLIATKKQIAEMSRRNDVNDYATQVDRLNRRSEEIQGRLARRFPELAGGIMRKTPRWQDVRATLRPGEAAVEILRFSRLENLRGSSTPHYAAAIVRGDRPNPVLVDLGPADGIEGPALTSYRLTGVAPNGRIAAPDRGALFRTAWAPLASALADVKTVYLSPDGVLNTVAFGILGDRATTVAETEDVRLVDSTKDLVERQPRSAAKSAVLFGDPAFDLTVAQQRVAVQGIGANEVAAAPGAADALPDVRGVTRGASLARLPGTAAEVSAIAALLRKNGWTSQTFVGDRALEEALISDVHGPRVLHLATHGAFLADPQRPAALAAALPQVPAAPAGSGTATEVAPVVLPPLADAELGSPQNDPMLRSMLFFAGANRTWTGQSTPPGGLDNGILTAAEASTLDLRGTELVVLSACETGLGSTQSGEGVFGLRRALREAGAGSILMSLWKIPDTETAEMLKAFYTHWLAGDEPHAALAKAQREERAIVQKRYGSDDPYYWGGLVLVGPPQR